MTTRNGFTYRFSRIVIAFWFLLPFFGSFGVAHCAEVDSLRALLSSTLSPTERSSIHLKLADHHWINAKDSCHYHLDKAAFYALSAQNNEQVIDVALSKSQLLFEQGDFDGAIEVLRNVLDEITDHSSPIRMARILSTLGSYYSQKGNQQRALIYYKQAVDYIEQDENPRELAILLGRMGTVYYLNDSYREAIINYKKAGKLFNVMGNKRGEATSLMNIGNCYKKLEMADSALTYYSSAYVQFRVLGDLPHNEAQCLANLGNLNYDQGRFTEAQRYLASADSLFTITQNSYSIALVSRDLAILYLKTNRLKLAKEKIDKSYAIAAKNGYDYIRLFAYRLLWEYHSKLNDCVNALSWLERYSTLKDTLYNIEKAENIDLLLTQFETEQKVKEIELLKQADTINQLKIRRRATMFYVTFLGLVIAIAFTVFLYFNIQRRKRINAILTHQNTEIYQQKEEITAQRDEIENQKNMLQDQNEALEQFRDHTHQSLRYAQSIQAAILPSQKILHQISADSFVMMKPCELVSGDFFWAATFNEYHVFCVADCTGHGVPGAFMSILGISALNDIVSRHRVTNPAEILGYLRESVIEALSQNDPDHLHKDGMDIALCVLNIDTRELQFAGAGLPLWLVAEDPINIEYNAIGSKFAHNGFTLFEVKGDIMPVGQSPQRSSFKNHTINLKGIPVRVYLATDGFADQLTGNQQKYGRKRQKQLILSHCSKSMPSQKQIFENEFTNWMGTSYQVDDATILGISLLDQSTDTL